MMQQALQAQVLAQKAERANAIAAGAPVTTYIDVPDECWVRVLGYLSGSELRMVGATCKLFLKLVQFDSLWEDLYRLIF